MLARHTECRTWYVWPVKTAYLFETEIGRPECSKSELTDSFLPPEDLDATLDQAVCNADSSQSPFTHALHLYIQDSYFKTHLMYRTYYFAVFTQDDH
jgi:hypothetical protein